MQIVGFPMRRLIYVSGSTETLHYIAAKSGSVPFFQFNMKQRHAALSANTHNKLYARNLTLSLRSSVSSCPVSGREVVRDGGAREERSYGGSVRREG